jgi:hypothetical protein
MTSCDVPIERRIGALAEIEPQQGTMANAAVSCSDAPDGRPGSRSISRMN